MREQDRTLEREHSICGFHKQVNLVERTWNDDLRAMSYGLGIAIVVLGVVGTTSNDFANLGYKEDIGLRAVGVDCALLARGPLFVVSDGLERAISKQSHLKILKRSKCKRRKRRFFCAASGRDRPSFCCTGFPRRM